MKSNDKKRSFEETEYSSGSEEELEKIEQFKTPNNQQSRNGFFDANKMFGITAQDHKEGEVDELTNMMQNDGNIGKSDKFYPVAPSSSPVMTETQSKESAKRLKTNPKEEELVIPGHP